MAAFEISLHSLLPQRPFSGGGTLSVFTCKFCQYLRSSFCCVVQRAHSCITSIITVFRCRSLKCLSCCLPVPHESTYTDTHTTLGNQSELETTVELINSTTTSPPLPVLSPQALFSGLPSLSPSLSFYLSLFSLSNRQTSYRTFLQNIWSHPQ